MFLFLTVLILISLFLDWYVFQAVKVLAGGNNFAYRSNNKRFIYWSYLVVFPGTNVALIISLFWAGAGTGGIPGFTQWMINIFITLFVTKLAYAVVLLAEDIYRFFATSINAYKKRGNSEDLMPERRKFISQLGLVVAGIPFASFVYGIALGKYNYKVHRQVVYFDDLPEAFDRFTITQLSDIHAGSFDNLNQVKEGIDLAKYQESDLLVFTGDMINNFASELNPWIPFFNQLQAPYGQFSIMGNHDYGEYVQWESPDDKAANIEMLKQHHKDLNYRLLLNDNIKIEKDGQYFELIGVENWGIGFIKEGDLTKALQGTEQQSFKILLSHDPSHWEEQVKSNSRKIHLTLSGHTHGMQVGIETPTFNWSPVQYRYAHWAGLKTINNRSIYINRGFGFIGFSGRVGIWPEITVLELRKGGPENETGNIYTFK